MMRSLMGTAEITTFLLYLTLAIRTGSVCNGFSQTGSISLREIGLPFHLPPQVRCTPRAAKKPNFVSSSNAIRHGRRSFAIYTTLKNGYYIKEKHEKEQSNVETNDNCSPLSRRDALIKTVVAATTAAATTLTNSYPAEAVTTEPTRIELQVDTEYLVKTLNFFDGDMRKALGALVRSPFTKVQIDPPNSLFTSDRDNARDAILRALYTYDRPDDYILQAKWLKVDNKKPSVLRSTISWLTKKRYKFEISGREDVSEKIKVSLSNLEIGASVLAVSYPLAFATYRYESYKEAEEAEAKRAAMAAKRAAAAKKKASAEKATGAKKIKGSEGAKEKTPITVETKKNVTPAAPGAPPPSSTDDVPSAATDPFAPPSFQSPPPKPSTTANYLDSL